MPYALNLFDIVPGQESTYREYLQGTYQQIQDLDAALVVAGHNPIRELRGEQRKNLMIVRFGTEADFATLMQRLQEKDLHRLREASTTNYIWTLFDDWDLLGFIKVKP